MRSWITIIESIEDDFDGYLYHVSPSSNAKSISNTGIQPVSYWSIGKITDYYEEEVTEDSGEAIVFKVPISQFDESLLEPDYPGIDEPLTYTLGMSEDDVQEAWDKSDQSWRDCLDIIGSVRYRGIVRP